jgi:predicted HTH domain antitoxin
MLTEIKFKEPLDISEEDARLYLAIKLFEEQKVSLAKASEIAEYRLATFVEILSKKNIPVINYPADGLREDILNA